MKKTSIYFSGLLLAFLLLGFQPALNAQVIMHCDSAYPTKIRSILDTPGQYNNEKVTVVGIVRNFIPGNSTSLAYYIIEGKFGDTIRVNTDAKQEPLRLTNYVVKGTLYIEIKRNSREPFIHEESRTKCTFDNDKVIQAEAKAKAEVKTKAEVIPVPWWKENLTLLLIAIGVLIVIIIVVIVIMQQSKKKELDARQYELEQKKRDEEKRANENRKASAAAKPILNDDDDYKTIKLFIDDPKTMKFIPGRLEIISGDDKGKTFLISGYPTPEGSVVTLGRESVTGERRYAHIQLDKRFQTVGRKQAEIIYRSGKLYVKNLGETNPTQVDGKELKVDQIAEVMPGSVIRTGELEFKYVV